MKTKGSRNKKGVRRILTIHGYYEVFQPKHPLAKKNGYVREHRMIAWDAGLLDDPKKIIHHKNEDKTDNCLSNLAVATNGEHTSLHWKGTTRPKWSKERRDAWSKLKTGKTRIDNIIYENPELLKV